MKQLFVTYNTSIKKKEERQNIFLCCERKEDKIYNNDNSQLINFPEKPTNNTLNTLNSSAISTTNSSTDSKKILYNISSPDQQTSISTNFSISSNTITNCSKYQNKNNNKFLGKKSKIRFNIDKSEDIKEFNINNFNTYNNSNSQSLDGTMTNKDIQNIDSMELIEENDYTNDNNNYFDTQIKRIKNREKKSYSLNSGRWSFKEHIQFIEAIAEYGKNWKKVQKHIGSRSSTQTRSHAQKFLLKLKAIKNPKFVYDYNLNNISSLSDIIDYLKKKDEYIKNGKDYIIKTLITLSESISQEYLDLNQSIKKNEVNEKEEIILKNNNDSIYNDNKNIKKFDILNDINNNNNKLKKRKNIKLKKFETNNIQISEDICENYNEKKNTISTTNEIKNNKYNIINDNINIFEKEKDENFESKINNNNNNNFQIEENININLKEKEFNNKYFIENPKRQKYIIDDGVMFLYDDSEFFYLENINDKIKEYNYLKNFEKLNYFYNKDFFS